MQRMPAKMMNVKNHHIYSDKLVLSVVDLSQIALATEDDEACGLAYWARLFKAKTWEELKMLAQQNEFWEEAVNSIYIANADDIVRQQCRAREDALRRERTLERDKNRLLAENASLQDENASLRKQLAELRAQSSK